MGLRIRKIRKVIPLGTAAVVKTLVVAAKSEAPGFVVATTMKL